MDQIQKILREVDALQEGHFLLSSGRHSNAYVQCAQLFQYPDQAAKVMALVAEEIKDVEFDILCGPAIGGIIASYELARQIGRPSIFTERKEGQMTLRRGFSYPEGTKILIVEDVVTTGKSSLETRDVLEEQGGDVVGIACVVNRSGRDDVGLPLYYGTSVDAETFDADELPDWLAEIPITQPGSRDMKKG